MEDQRSRSSGDLLKRAATETGLRLRTREGPESGAPPSGDGPGPVRLRRAARVRLRRAALRAVSLWRGTEKEPPRPSVGRSRRRGGAGAGARAGGESREAAEQAPDGARRERERRRAAARVTRARPAACQPVGQPRPRPLGPRRRRRPGLGLPGPGAARPRPRRTSEGASERRPPGPPSRPGRRMTELQSALLLRRQLAELNKNPVEGFSAGLIDDNDLYRWEVLIIGPPDTLYEGGVFKAHLTFPKDYPLRPPKMKFITEIWHPNVDKNGDVCISILHEPGEDKYGYEKPEERWLPIHTVETIMISVISMLADPNGDSPANVDAAKEWREDRNGEFKRKVARCVRKSQETAFE
ncbi:ubiquitin-conjugating enzyme E2 G1 [Antechinus flavipes]|uniref:ubiquitin-conjugating enzyme E2 G1 n=1 Tax=Antechinus flavipes TaxID=38775 RepID=UPI0022369B43|nr:ubiquitin-conjugating enzyme E2 G1 [Antechinus flavipes]